MKTIWTSTTLVKLLTLVSIVSFMPMVLAKLPHASEIVHITGKRVMFQEGKQRRKPAQIGQKLASNNQKLIVSGNNRDLARLIFLGGNDNYDGLLLQAGPDSRETQYQFPCTLEKGKVTIGWQQGKNRGCEEGIFLSPQDSNKSHNKQDMKVSSLEQKSLNTFIRPHQTDAILFQVNNRKQKQTVQAIKGDLWISTPNYPAGFVLKEGEQWNNDQASNQETINKIQVTSIVDSEEIQDFLNFHNWSSQSMSKQNNYLLEKHLNALQGKSNNTVVRRSDKPLMNLFCQVAVNNYITQIKNSLNGTWQPVKPPSRGIWKSLVSYTITKDGQVENVHVLQTSGYEPLDEAAINHVYNLENQLPPFPDCYPENSLPIDHLFKLTYY